MNMPMMFTITSSIFGWVETNPLVFWYQWEYLLTSYVFLFFAGYLRLAMIDVT